MPLFFPHSALSATAAAAASDISPGTHFLLSGLKMDTELFLKGKINNMADKDTIGKNPSPGAPDADNLNAAAQYDGFTDSDSPYLLINRIFPPYSTNTMKNQKKREKIDDKVTIYAPPPPPLPLTYLILIPPIITLNIMVPTTPISYIHWEIAKFPPTPPIPWKLEKK